MRTATKLSVSSALLVVAIVSLAGVGFAIGYTGYVDVDTNPSSGELVTVSAVTTGFHKGIYTLDTANDGTAFALSNLKYWESVSDDSADTVTPTRNFAYSDGAFSLTDSSKSGYVGAVIGTATVTIYQSGDAQADTVTLTASGAETGTANQYGMSIVYTYTVGGTETVVADPNTAQAVTLTSGTATVVLTAYLVYSESVPVASQSSISAYALNGSTVRFVAEASIE